MYLCHPLFHMNALICTASSGHHCLTLFVWLSTRNQGKGGSEREKRMSSAPKLVLRCYSSPGSAVLQCWISTHLTFYRHTQTSSHIPFLFTTLGLIVQYNYVNRCRVKLISNTWYVFILWSCHWFTFFCANACKHMCNNDSMFTSLLIVWIHLFKISCKIRQVMQL